MPSSDENQSKVDKCLDKYTERGWQTIKATDFLKGALVGQRAESALANAYQSAFRKRHPAQGRRNSSKTMDPDRKIVWEAVKDSVLPTQVCRYLDDRHTWVVPLSTDELEPSADRHPDGNPFLINSWRFCLDQFKYSLFDSSAWPLKRTYVIGDPRLEDELEKMFRERERDRRPTDSNEPLYGFSFNCMSIKL